MPWVTNIGRSGLDFVVGVENGVAQTEHLRAGEVRNLAVDVNSAQVRGRVFAGLIKVEVVRIAGRSEGLDRLKAEIDRVSEALGTPALSEATPRNRASKSTSV